MRHPSEQILNEWPKSLSECIVLLGSRKVPHYCRHRGLFTAGNSGDYGSQRVTQKEDPQSVEVCVIICDDLGYFSMSRESMYNVFALINAMYEYRSLIITTNKDFTNWGEFFFEDNVAVPIVDRIIHYSHIFMLRGVSYRFRHKLNS